EYLSMEKVANLPTFLKVKHLIFYFLGEAPCEEILSLLSTLSYFVIKKEGDELVKVFMPLSISEFLYFSNLWVKEDIITDKEREGLIFQLKGYIPECFSSI
ncbi:MAG: hypothetical protein P3W84_000985, partial [Thermodesulfobacteriaceae bacterium]|nr:hypothetical protein [Thermodesulfobacteriaceae bacterium]